ncbi:MAG TPA: hypothetical protein V6C91_04310 [Coleofasciculaceae cyanobacterium]
MNNTRCRFKTAYMQVTLIPQMALRYSSGYLILKTSSSVRSQKLSFTVAIAKTMKTELSEIG